MFLRIVKSQCSPFSTVGGKLLHFYKGKRYPFRTWGRVGQRSQPPFSIINASSLEKKQERVQDSDFYNDKDV